MPVFCKQNTKKSAQLLDKFQQMNNSKSRNRQIQLWQVNQLNSEQFVSNDTMRRNLNEILY